MSKKAFGSGYFGEWIEDEHGLPAYKYTCDQINDPKAITPVNEEFRSKTDHSFLVGNDRLVGVASNYGYIQVRQDEGGPKYLNDYDPENQQYAGGFGYLIDGEHFLSTFYSDHTKQFERYYGIGYMRRIVGDQFYTIDQIIYAPFGDDPILISQVKITNKKNDGVNLRWIEYWGCQMYQFTINSYGLALAKKDLSFANKHRRDINKQFKHKFSVIGDNLGLFEEKFLKSNKTKKEKNNIDTKNESKKVTKKLSFEDWNPRPTFLISLDKKADNLYNNSPEFFGRKDVYSPENIHIPLNHDLSRTDENCAMFIERKFFLEPGQTTTMYFVFGYLPEGFNLNSLIKKYKNKISEGWLKSSINWAANLLKLNIANESWINREIIWHNYYLRSAMTFDDYFQEHILSQGYVYQYIIGFQGAARDPLQHAKPFLFCEPLIVKEILRYTLKEVQSDGHIPYAITGSGIIAPLSYKPSDLELWLLWLISEYVLITRDKDFFDEILPIYPIYGKKAKKLKVREIVSLCYKYFSEIIGTGQHGLQRLSNGDWNDTIVIGHVPEENHTDIIENAESVLNSTMAVYILNLYAEMLTFLGEKEATKKISEYANSLKDAVKQQWTGKWFKRAWLTESIGWIGEDQLWLEPQPWAIIAGITDMEHRNLLINNIDELLRKSSSIGAMLQSEGLKNLKKLLGLGSNAGIWPSINGTLIMALSLIDGNMAWDEWKKNSLAYHAENYPDVWYGIWSGPDTYNSNLSKYPGHTVFNEFLLTGDPKDNIEALTSTGLNFTDFPVLNLHSHAWLLYNCIHLIGAKFTKEGIEFSPVLPKDKYEFNTKILGFKKSKMGYSGWYSPLEEGNWKITLHLTEEEINSIQSLKINSKQEKFNKNENSISWIGRSRKNKPLFWELSLS
ncbi:MAG: GH36-type glycosyl hydrolase domain-containing protein [Candidatus Hodarchaeota archaeon]